MYPAESRACSGFNLLLLSAIVFLFLLGFVLGEDALGGGIRADLYSFHGPTIYAFHDHPWAQTLPDYDSATTPLFHILESFNPTLGYDTAFRASNLLLALLTVILVTFALVRRFAGEITLLWPILLVGASILLSPYFRAESYWASTDILPIFFLTVTALFILPVQDGEPQTLNPFLLILLTAIVSWCAFYTRQTYLFAPAYAGILLLLALRRERWFTVILFTALGVPALYLVHLWHGLVPPQFKHHQKLSINGFVAPLSIIFIYAIPFLIEAAIVHFRQASSAGSLKRLLPWALAGWLLFLAIFHSYRFDEQTHGGGIAAKFCSRLGAPGVLLFVSFGFAGLLITAWLFRACSWRGRLLIVLVLVPVFAMSEFYQKYFDPLLIVLFFLFIDRAVVRPFIRPRPLYLMLGFNALLLVGALAYNAPGHSEFLPLTSPVHPWTHTELDGRFH